MADAVEFDLNTALHDWREGLKQSPHFRAENLEELETHLRDAVATLRGRGLSEEESFWLAARRLGTTGQLSAEFGKLNPGLVWRSRALWGLFGILAYLAVANLARAISAGAILAGSYFMASGFWLGWLGVGGEVAVVLLALIYLRRLTRPDSQSAGGFAARFRPQRVGWLVTLLVVILISKILNASLVAGEVAALSPVTLGQAFLVGLWFDHVGAFVVLVALAVACVRLRPAKSLTDRRLWLLLFLVASCTGLTQGCSRKSGTVSEKPATVEPHDPTVLEQSMSLWAAGNQDTATEKFMSVDWSAGQPFSTGAILNYSETQFAALPQAARDKIGKQLIDDLNTLKAICSRVNDLGKQAQGNGDRAQAEKCFLQLQHCGEALDQPDRTQLARLVGQALKKLSAKQLSGLKN
jgi:hypothetical protein